MSLVGVNEQTHRNFKKSGNLSRFLWIGNTKEETHERLIRPSTKLNELLFEERERESEGDDDKRYDKICVSESR
jgi:hypothetical protein